MSQQDIDGFLQQVLADGGTFAQLSDAVGDREGEAAYEAVAAFAADRGFTVSTGEVAAAQSQILDAIGANAALSDDALDEVSGGAIRPGPVENKFAQIARQVSGFLREKLDFLNKW